MRYPKLAVEDASKPPAMMHPDPSASAVTEGDVRLEGKGGAETQRGAGELRSKASTEAVYVDVDEPGVAKAIVPPKTYKVSPIAQEPGDSRGLLMSGSVDHESEAAS